MRPYTYMLPHISLFVSLLINYYYPRLQNTSVGFISEKTRLDISPAKYAFSIWGLIYLGLILLVFLKKNWDNSSIMLFVLSCVFNSLWIIVWLRKPQSNTNNIYLGNIILPLITVTLLMFWFNNLTSKLNSKEAIYNTIFQNIIALYAGWCIGASLINTGITAKNLFNVSQKNISYFVVGSLCVIHLLWQFYGVQQKNSFMKDSIMVPLVGLWTSFAILNNGRTPELGQISTLVTLLCSVNHIVNVV